MFKTKTTVPGLAVDYDVDTDVLFISNGYACPSEGTSRQDGLIVRHPLNDPLVACGVVVVQFRASGWASNVGKLAVVVANILSVEREQMFGALRRYRARNGALGSHAA
jgi:hypothetical protein